MNSYISNSLRLLGATLLLSVGLARTTPAADVSGTWAGRFTIHFPGGRAVEDHAWFTLRQAGQKLEGSVGPSAAQQQPVRDAEVSGDAVTFISGAAGGKELMFRLRLAGSHLVGTAVGEMGNDRVTVDLDVERQPAAEPIHDALFDEISACDARLFDAFNRRDLAGLMSQFSRDLEFYHDRGGLTGYAQNLDQFRRALSEPTRHRRELVPGTLVVSPLGDSFALEIGVHRFYDTPPAEAERLAATAQFVNVWERTGNACHLRRAISYDHR